MVKLLLCVSHNFVIIHSPETWSGGSKDKKKSVKCVFALLGCLTDWTESVTILLNVEKSRLNQGLQNKETHFSFLHSLLHANVIPKFHSNIFFRHGIHTVFCLYLQHRPSRVYILTRYDRIMNFLLNIYLCSILCSVKSIQLHLFVYLLVYVKGDLL